MTIPELLTADKAGPILRPLFKAQNGRLTAIHLGAGEVIREHKSPVPAMLLVLEGGITYTQSGDGLVLQVGKMGYVEIPLDTIHQVSSEVGAYCLLIQ